MRADAMPERAASGAEWALQVVNRWVRRGADAIHRVLPQSRPVSGAPGLLPSRAALHAMPELAPGPPTADECANVRRVLRARPLDRTAQSEALAVAARAHREVTGRTPWPTQWQAAQALLQGQLVEMATGEGKSLATALAAATAALGGHRVHLMTANDYLVQRDAQAAAAWCELLGLRVGCVTGSSDPVARHAAYRADITFCTAREVAFDHLRDARAGWVQADPLRSRADGLLQTGLDDMPVDGPDSGCSGASPEPLLPALSFAIVDEADSLLVDEGSMPLILSEVAQGAAARQQAARQRAMAFQAMGLARRLVMPEDVVYRSADAARPWHWSITGTAKLESAAASLGGLWLNRNHRRDQVELALHALHHLQADRDYVVRDGQVLIVDPATGRSAVGRSWSRGLQALVEAKEGCTVRPPAEVVARISLQRFFGRYQRLAGCSGTLTEARRELLDVFGRPVRAVPLRRASRRTDLGLRVFASAAERCAAVPPRVAALVAGGRPVLVGTDSVAATEAICKALTQAGLAHQRLDARHDADEAQVIASAGQAGRVTVATQLAGRGTDIVPDTQALAAGGLHVLACIDPGSARLDRQLIGRAARAGDAGSGELWRALDAQVWSTPGRGGRPDAGDDDDGWHVLVDRCVLGVSSRWLHSRHPTGGGALAPAALRVWLAWRQARHERSAAHTRRVLLEQDLQWQTRTGYLPSAP